MKKSVTYFRLQLKRFFQMFPTIFVLSLVLFVSLGILFVSFFNQSSGSVRNSMVKLGIVGDLDEVYMDLAVTTLKNIDSSRYSIDLILIPDEETARESLLNGDIIAYAKFPKDFVLNALEGKVENITIAMTEESSGMGASMVNEIVNSVSEYLKNSSKAANAFYYAALDRGFDMSEDIKLTGDYSINIINMVLSRDSMYEVEEIGSVGAEEVEDRLFCGIAVLFLLLWGLTCCQLFVPKKRALTTVLKSNGTGVLSQIIGEYLSYLAFMIATISLLVIGAVIIVPLLHVEEVIADVNIFKMIPGMILPILAISSMHFFIYEAADGFVGSMLLQFGVAMGTGYISGCLYPPFFFPRIVQQAASVLPAWSARVHLNEWIYSGPSAETSIILILYFIAFITLSVIIRWYRITRSEGGI